MDKFPKTIYDFKTGYPTLESYSIDEIKEYLSALSNYKKVCTQESIEANKVAKLAKEAKKDAEEIFNSSWNKSLREILAQKITLKKIESNPEKYQDKNIKIDITIKAKDEARAKYLVRELQRLQNGN
jgi:hypothetical protein